MYRPKNWAELKAHIYHEAHPIARSYLTEKLIEGTADAILEALKEQGRYYPPIRKHLIDKQPGWVTFIPDD